MNTRKCDCLNKLKIKLILKMTPLPLLMLASPNPSFINITTFWSLVSQAKSFVMINHFAQIIPTVRNLKSEQLTEISVLLRCVSRCSYKNYYDPETARPILILSLFSRQSLANYNSAIVYITITMWFLYIFSYKTCLANCLNR